VLFNSPEFLLGFLPATLIVFFLVGATLGPARAQLWLVAASLFFYGWWRLEFLPLLVVSICFNYAVGRALSRRPRRWLLMLGIAGNLAALGWFKYSGFLAAAIDELTGAGLPIPQIALPLAISFYTFQQIAYLVDANAGNAERTSPARYALFVVFFPQLIAGPIVHHRELIEQFERPDVYRPRTTTLILGIAAFALGLFKKVILADPLGTQALLAFGPSVDGTAPGFADSWYGAIAYALQLYFDFSGYSDMAIGLGLMFGIRLPVNFASPYKSASIVEFWSRWHMTLTRFLTAYIYNPISIAITRRRAAAGKPLFRPSVPKTAPFLMQMALPTLVTMGLAGIWHGAGWQFAIFGLLHGAMLVVNHGWRLLRRALGFGRPQGWATRGLGVLVTFLAVTVSFVFFRSANLDQALAILRGMAGLGGEVVKVARLGAPEPGTVGPLAALLSRFASLQGLVVVGGLAVVWLLPSAPQYIETLSGTVSARIGSLRRLLRWPLLRPRQWAAIAYAGNNPLQGAAIGILLSLALLRALSVAPSEFLYFTF
jgi:D-alanyl-lipoteichoic acid acyltransferase DltB (MBOAT superfamily)